MKPKKNRRYKITLMDTIKANRAARRLDEPFIKPAVHIDKKKQRNKLAARKWKWKPE